MLIEPLFKQSLGDRVAEMLRDEIVSGRLKPGARVNLEEYRTHWDISITPLRDAAKRLEADGLVTISPRRGVFVATIDKAALLEIFEVRLALEPLVTERATSHIPADDVRDALADIVAARDLTPSPRRDKRLTMIDQAVHEMVLKHCPNTRLAKLMSGLRDSILWSQNAVRRSVTHAFEPSIEEHIAICEALLTRDGRRAAAAMAAHISSTRSRTEVALGDIDTSERLPLKDQPR